MKKIILLTFLTTSSIFFNSCSGNDDENSNTANTIYAKKWYVSDQRFLTTNDGKACESSYYNLKSNGTVEYRYMVSSWHYNCEHDTEMGTWSVEGNILTRHFPSDPGTENEIIMKDEIMSVSETDLKLKSLEEGYVTTLYSFD